MISFAHCILSLAKFRRIRHFRRFPWTLVLRPFSQILNSAEISPNSPFSPNLPFLPNSPLLSDPSLSLILLNIELWRNLAEIAIFAQFSAFVGPPQSACSVSNRPQSALWCLELALGTRLGEFGDSPSRSRPDAL